MFELKNWSMILSGVYAKAQGHCFGNPKFPDGLFIHTSPVVETEVDLEKVHIICITRSGSHYYMDFSELGISFAEETKIAMGHLGIAADILDMCICRTKEKKQYFMEKLNKTLEKGDLFLSLAGVNAISAYFMHDSLVEMVIAYHTGMIQDSVLIRDLENYKADFRYFPYLFEIEPYHTSEEIRRIIILNSGEEILFRGSSGETLLKRG